MKTKQKYKLAIRERLARQRAFFSSKEPGDFLVYIAHWTRLPLLELYGYDRLFRSPVEDLCRAEYFAGFAAGFKKELQKSYRKFFSIEDDMLPATAEVYFGIGSVTSAMTGRPTRFCSQTSWLEANMKWDEIEKLQFNPDNIWIQFVRGVASALWDCWDEDFFILPYLHRSPLDGAMGIRGQDLFEDLYLDPERAKKLIEWCADWSIQTEKFLGEEVSEIAEWGRGAWGTWLPHRATFVNGDPVGMINRTMQPVFDRPYTEKLFTTVNGGFFHHHAIGLHQIDQVAQSRGMLVQEVLPDPNQPHPVDVILNSEEKANEFVQASLKAPIMLHTIPPALLNNLLSALAGGRFILVIDTEDRETAVNCINLVREKSN